MLACANITLEIPFRLLYANCYHSVFKLLQDELDSAHSVSFTPDGTLIYAGFIKQIHVFDVTRPGAQIESIKTHKKRQTGQTGIISCFDFLPQNRTFAAGSYSRSSQLVMKALVFCNQSHNKKKAQCFFCKAQHYN